MSLDRLVDKVYGLVSWARVGATKALAGKLGKVQVRAHVDDELQHWQSYGFQSRPLAGADAVVLAMGGHSDQRIALLVGDRRYNIALEGGEVAIVDDLGQRVHLTRTGIVLEAPLVQLGAGAALGVARVGDPVALDATPGTSWADQVKVAINLLAPGSVSASPTGVITDGSSKVKAE